MGLCCVLLCAAFSSMTLEMLGCLMHEGPNRCFSARLNACVVRCIQIGDSHPVHDGLDDGRGGHARHAGKGINVDHTAVAFFNKLQNGRDADTGFGCNIKGKDIFSLEQFFQVTHLVIVLNIDQPGGAFVELSLFHFLIEKICTGVEDFMKIVFQSNEIQLLEV